MTEIEQIRVNLGLSRDEFAKLLGVTSASVRNWEKGRNKPSPLSHERIFQVLGRFRRQIKRVERAQG